MLSIIVPVYNAINTLDRCLNSLLKQRVDGMRIILVDDGSNDGSRDKCDEWAGKYDNIIVIHKENGGLSDARNVGIEQAESDFITFVDADDFLQDNPGGFRHLHIEIIVADKAEKDAVAVDAIVSHHLFHGNLTSARTLVDDVLYKVRTASHIVRLLIQGQRYALAVISARAYLFIMPFPPALG